MACFLMDKVKTIDKFDCFSLYIHLCSFLTYRSVRTSVCLWSEKLKPLSPVFWISRHIKIIVNLWLLSDVFVCSKCPFVRLPIHPSIHSSITHPLTYPITNSVPCDSLCHPPIPPTRRQQAGTLELVAFFTKRWDAMLFVHFLHIYSF